MPYMINFKHINIIIYYICTAQTSCVINPNISTLTIRDGLQRDVELHCQCMDDNGTIVTGARWFQDGSLVLTEDDTNRSTNSPYYINATITTLYINRRFTTSDTGTYTCSPNSTFPTIPPGDAITLNAASEQLYT